MTRDVDQTESYNSRKTPALILYWEFRLYLDVFNDIKNIDKD